jgi:hypothetical protein
MDWRKALIRLAFLTVFSLAGDIRMPEMIASSY